MGAMLHQRAFLPLHASVVQIGECCVALMGCRGAGKSTLAAFIASTGGEAISDDICAVTFVDDRPIVWPNRQRFKLSDDVAARLDVELGDAERLAGGKLSVRVPTSDTDKPKRLDAVFVLESDIGTATNEVRRLTRLNALAALVEHTFRPRYVIALGIGREHVRRCGAVAETTPVFRLSIVRDLTRLDDAASLIALASQAASDPIAIVPPFADTGQPDGPAGALTS
jgi:hypothetical protein